MIESLCSGDDVRTVSTTAGVRSSSSEAMNEAEREKQLIQRSRRWQESVNWIYFAVTAPGMKRKGNESQLIKHLLWFNESRHLFLLLFTGLCEFLNCNQKGKLLQETYGILYKCTIHFVSFQTELDLKKLLITVFIEHFNSHWKMGIHSFMLPLLL